MAADFRIMTPRIFSDERLYPLDSDHKWIYSYCVGGLQSCGLTQTGIYKIGRGEISVGANVDMAKTEKVIDFFSKTHPDLLEYDDKNHVIFIKSLLKYLIRYGFTKIGLPLVKAVHKDFKRYGDKNPRFFAELTHLYHDEFKDSMKQISVKDKNYSYYKSTFDTLFTMEELFFPSENTEKASEKPKTEIAPVSIERIKQTLDNIFQI